MSDFTSEVRDGVRIDWDAREVIAQLTGSAERR